MLKRAFPRPFRHVCLFAASTALVVTTNILCSARYVEEHRALQKESKEQRVRSIVEGWGDRAFITASPGAFLAALAESEGWRSLDIDSAQRRLLEQRLEAVIGYLVKPDFENYLLLKTDGIAWHPSLLKADFFAGLDATLSEDGSHLSPREQIEKNWDDWSLQLLNDSSSRLSSFSTNDISATIGHDSHRPAILGNKEVGKGFTVAALSPGFGIDYDNYDSEGAPSDTIGDLNVYLSFYARFSNESPGPVHFVFHWSQQDANWIPVWMFTDKTMRAQLPF